MPPSGSAEQSPSRPEPVHLLFDEQLSEVLVRKLVDVFPHALHVRLLNRGGAPDPDVWELAREHGGILVTKDGDFHRLSLLHGARRGAADHVEPDGRADVFVAARRTRVRLRRARRAADA